jgi:hypothetical protein
MCLLEGPTWASVSDVHVGPGDVEALLAQVRELVPRDKPTTWWIGPSVEPSDLSARLASLGLGEPADRAGVLHALASTREPPPGPADVEVHRVDAFDDFATAVRVAWDAFGTPQRRREADELHLRSSFAAQRDAGVPATFLARIDGEPAGSARSIYSEHGVFLIGGAVASAFRRRGVYRALVRARWDDAVAVGTPALVVEANPSTSYPILLRFGFEQVCVIHRLEDFR